MRLLYNESACCTIIQKDRAIDKIIVRQCDACAILQSIARMLVQDIEVIYTTFSRLSRLTTIYCQKGNHGKIGEK